MGNNESFIINHTTHPAGLRREKEGKTFALYYKQLYIVQEPLIKNRTCQSWRGKQIALCEEEKPLQDYIEKQKDKEKYYIEKLGF